MLVESCEHTATENQPQCHAAIQDGRLGHRRATSPVRLNDGAIPGTTAQPLVLVPPPSHATTWCHPLTCSCTTLSTE